MTKHYISREVDHRDVLHVDYDPDTDEVLQFRIVREPWPPGHYAPQQETIASYRGDAAQIVYEIFQDVAACSPALGGLELDIEDDQQVAQESAEPAIEPYEEVRSFITALTDA